MQMIHTVGPWGAVVGQSADGKCTVGPQNGGIAIAHVVAEVNGAANALLIAAAPDMLAALRALLNADVFADGEGLVSISRPETESGELAVAAARAAIARATGTSA